MDLEKAICSKEAICEAIFHSISYFIIHSILLH